MDTVQLIELTSRECKAYLNDGGDLAFIPVGSIERLGPHLPMGARCYVVRALCGELAKVNGGYCLPLLPYSTCYAASALKGTIDVDHKIVCDLCYDIGRELMANGFRRIIFVSYLKEFYYIISEFFQQEDMAIAWISPERVDLDKPVNLHEKETSMIAACIKLCGRDDLLANLLDTSRKLAGQYRALVDGENEVSRMAILGSLGHMHKDGDYEILPVDNVYVDDSVSDIKKWIKSKVGAIEALKEYNYYLARGRKSRGFL